MKKFYTFCICSLMSICTYSQIILIDQVVFEPGDNISVVFSEADASEGSAGQNVVWDYSSATGSDTITWLGVDPVDHDIAQEYWPDSDLGAFIPAPSNDSIEFKIYEFYDFDQSRIATLGSYSILKNNNTNESDTQIVNYSSDPFEEFEFPLAYLDEFESDYSGSVTGSFQGFETETKRGGTVIMKADATGTIHTPTGTYNNVLRVKRIETRFDTSFFEFEGQVFESVLETENIIYDWLQPERKFSLYRIGYTTITQQGFPPQNILPFAFFTIENGVLDVEDDLDPISINLYPNPTSNEIFIQDFDKLNLKFAEIHDLKGNQILKIRQPSESLSLADLQSGMYILTLHSDHGTYTQKFSKM